MDLVAEGFEIVSVAAINLDRDRLPLAVGQKPDDDLFVALLVVPIIPPSRQGVGVALQITAAHIVEKELVLGRRGPSVPQAPLDEGVTAFEPGAVGIEKHAYIVHLY